MRVISVSAAVEAIAGIVLAVSPAFFVWLIFGASLPPIGQDIGRLAGFALIALAAACWPAANGAAAARGLLVYNVLATLLFLEIGVAREFVGVLLWPAVALHAVFSLLLLRIVLQRDVSKTT